LVGLFLSVSFYISQAEDPHAQDSVKGNVICLIPDYEKGSVNPVIATEPCDGLPTHTHVIVEQRGKVGNVYAVQGSPEALKRLEQAKNRTNVEIKGKISGGSDTGWVITVD
jgi:hypothetical protein